MYAVLPIANLTPITCLIHTPCINVCIIVNKLLRKLGLTAYFYRKSSWNWCLINLYTCNLYTCNFMKYFVFYVVASTVVFCGVTRCNVWSWRRCDGVININCDLISPFAKENSYSFVVVFLYVHSTISKHCFGPRIE